MREPFRTQPNPPTPPWLTLLCGWLMIFTANLAALWVWN
jgi:hypothetical protein